MESIRILVLIIYFIPLFVAFYVCEWQVVVAFIIGVWVVPPVLFALSEGASYLIHGEFTVGLNDIFSLGMIFSLVGMFIYFVAILPLYYVLQTLDYSIYLTFPSAIFLVMLILFTLLATQSLGVLGLAVVLFCSIVHSLMILWIIDMLKALT
ncbi:hypothetical protein RCC89_03745 [Cytophagaceae bacterium ABcell3]|nr:hypothetical protein RCC89_03745 [Cytophagaceae bacterium ABcell3]